MDVQGSAIGGGTTVGLGVATGLAFRSANRTHNEAADRRAAVEGPEKRWRAAMAKVDEARATMGVRQTQLREAELALPPKTRQAELARAEIDSLASKIDELAKAQDDAYKAVSPLMRDAEFALSFARGKETLGLVAFFGAAIAGLVTLGQVTEKS